MAESAALAFPTPAQLLDDPDLTIVPIEPLGKTVGKTKNKNRIAREKKKKERGVVTGDENRARTVKQTQTQKAKQTKSRDGCRTCKIKRLKCDEGKPGCVNCQKRGIKCGGYSKSFQWRSHEKATFELTHAPSHRKQRSTVNISPNPPPSSPNDDHVDPAVPQPGWNPFDISMLPLDPGFAKASLEFYEPGFGFDAGPDDQIVHDVNELQDDFAMGLNEMSILPAVDDDDVLIDCGDCENLQNDFQPLSLLPKDLSDTIQPVLISDEPSPQAQLVDDKAFSVDRSAEEAIDPKDIVIQDNGPSDCLQLSYPSPSLSSSSSSSAGSMVTSLYTLNLPAQYSGILHRIFDERTCGILSIKDGPNENPWRNLLWPIALSEPALYYAMLSMTASHAAKNMPGLETTGRELQSMSVGLLRQKLFTMPADLAVATTLVLAFSESWLSHIYTGIMHLRGARQFILRGLQQQDLTTMAPRDAARLKFLRSTWVYMDIIARLTAVDGDDPGDLDTIAMPAYGPDAPRHEIDPLMGCATTFFPYIGAVANLVRQVRRTASNTRRLVSRAADLKDSILKWKIPDMFTPPEDETLEVEHSRHTAEAYRWATLLYLCQAVPLICSQDPAVMAEKALDHLSAVPTTSRSVIIHIFPLLAAGCEASSQEDRSFVEERWTAMMHRMCIGNVDRCWEVVREVWDRRDAAKAHDTFELDPDDFGLHDSAQLVLIPTCGGPASSMQESGESTKGPTNIHVRIDPAMTVRGRLHWVAVMTERKWEILLG